MTTLMKVILVAAAPLMAAAQRPAPAAPPAPPTPQAKPAPPAKPAEPWGPKFEFDYEFKHDFKHDLKFDFKELELQHKFDLEMLKPQFEQHKFELEMLKPQFEDMKWQAEDLKWQAKQFAQDFHFEPGHAIPIPPMPPTPPMPPMPPLPPLSFDYKGEYQSESFLSGKPRQSWAHEDPADSLYRVAREALNRGEYRRAANTFNEVTRRFPKSVYALDCLYWEAFSRYRAGTTEDLRQGLKILEDGRTQLQYLRPNESNMDVQSLRARILSTLSSRGDSDAARKLQSEAAQSTGCDKEDVSVRAEALSALGQMDAALALPSAKKVLANRDECTIELRRRALYLVGRNPTSEAADIFMDVAKNDTDAGIRGEAMSWLSRIAGDKAIPLLESMLKTSTDERQQRYAIQALGSIDTEAARRAVRAIIERTDVNERVRADAINSLSRERDGRSVSPEEITYLRSLYTKVESDRLKMAVLEALGRVGGPDSEQFLLALARNANESASLRSSAISRLGRMSSVSLDNIAKLYDVADSRSMREQILNALGNRKESEAVDKIIDIARKDTDPQIRRRAINILGGRQNDPRVAKLLQEFFEKP